MTPKHLLVLLMAIVASQIVAGQNEEDIPIENDNQFPPDTITDGGKMEEVELEGSGDGNKLAAAATSNIEPPIENMEGGYEMNMETASTSDELLCPTECSCSLEGGTNNFITDCSGHDLTEFPKNINPQTTILNIQNNKLVEIPKEVSLLTKLKTLKANNNSIKDLATGSISELPDLEVLNLAGNRLIEYPQDLKNSFTLTKLEELDLSGNDMRTVLTAENFINFKSLRKLTLAVFTTESAESLCSVLKDKLETICIESCTEQTIDCSNLQINFKEEEELLGVLPTSFSANIANVDDSDSDINSNIDKEDDLKTTEEAKEQTTTTNNDVTTTSKSDEFSLRSAVNQAPITVAATDSDNSVINSNIDKEEDFKNTKETSTINKNETNLSENATLTGVNQAQITVAATDSDNSVINSNIDKEDGLKNTKETSTINKNGTNLSENTTKLDEFSLRSAVNQASSGIVAFNTLVDTPIEATSGTGAETDPNVKIGATTTEKKTGGVDKSVIGIIIAGMVVVVAGITIKKNWNSIKKRFSSTSRTPNQNGTGANGSAPEEVPLQDKSPV